MESCLASSTYNAAYSEAIVSSVPAAQRAVYEHSLSADPSSLQAGLDIKVEYGSLDGYLSRGLDPPNQDLARLRDALLLG